MCFFGTPCHLTMFFLEHALFRLKGRLEFWGMFPNHETLARAFWGVWRGSRISAVTRIISMRYCHLFSVTTISHCNVNMSTLIQCVVKDSVRSLICMNLQATGITQIIFDSSSYHNYLYTP